MKNNLRQVAQPVGGPTFSMRHVKFSAKLVKNALHPLCVISRKMRNKTLSLSRKVLRVQLFAEQVQLLVNVGGGPGRHRELGRVVAVEELEHCHFDVVC